MTDEGHPGSDGGNSASGDTPRFIPVVDYLLEHHEDLFVGTTGFSAKLSKAREMATMLRDTGVIHEKAEPFLDTRLYIGSQDKRAMSDIDAGISLLTKQEQQQQDQTFESVATHMLQKRFGIEEELRLENIAGALLARSLQDIVVANSVAYRQGEENGQYVAIRPWTLAARLKRIWNGEPVIGIAGNEVLDFESEIPLRAPGDSVVVGLEKQYERDEALDLLAKARHDLFSSAPKAAPAFEALQTDGTLDGLAILRYADRVRGAKPLSEEVFQERISRALKLEFSNIFPFFGRPELAEFVHTAPGINGPFLRRSELLDLYTVLTHVMSREGALTRRTTYTTNDFDTMCHATLAEYDQVLFMGRLRPDQRLNDHLQRVDVLDQKSPKGVRVTYPRYALEMQGFRHYDFRATREFFNHFNITEFNDCMQTLCLHGLAKNLRSAAGMPDKNPFYVLANRVFEPAGSPEETVRSRVVRLIRAAKEDANLEAVVATFGTESEPMAHDVATPPDDEIEDLAGAIRRNQQMLRDRGLHPTHGTLQNLQNFGALDHSSVETVDTTYTAFAAAMDGYHFWTFTQLMHRHDLRWGDIRDPMDVLEQAGLVRDVYNHLGLSTYGKNFYVWSNRLGGTDEKDQLLLRLVQARRDGSQPDAILAKYATDQPPAAEAPAPSPLPLAPEPNAARPAPPEEIQVETVPSHEVQPDAPVAEQLESAPPVAATAEPEPVAAAEPEPVPLPVAADEPSPPSPPPEAELTATLEQAAAADDAQPAKTDEVKRLLAQEAAAAEPRKRTRRRITVEQLDTEAAYEADVPRYQPAEMPNIIHAGKLQICPTNKFKPKDLDQLLKSFHSGIFEAEATRRAAIARLAGGEDLIEGTDLMGFLWPLDGARLLNSTGTKRDLETSLGLDNGTYDKRVDPLFRQELVKPYAHAMAGIVSGKYILKREYPDLLATLRYCLEQLPEEQGQNGPEDTPPTPPVEPELERALRIQQDRLEHMGIMPPPKEYELLKRAGVLIERDVERTQKTYMAFAEEMDEWCFIDWTPLYQACGLDETAFNNGPMKSLVENALVQDIVAALGGEQSSIQVYVAMEGATEEIYKTLGKEQPPA